MKWRQAQELGGIIGVMVAGMGLFLFQANTSLGLLLVLMFVGLLVGRWTGKWLHAIGKWYLRGSRGRRHVTCPGCGRRIWRRKRHWILRCENCGWKPGWPIVRWFWESVPARALRVHGPTFRQIAKAFVLIFITTILVGASIGTGFQAIDQPAQRRADQILNSSVDGKVQTPEAVSTTEDRSEHCNLVESTSKKNEINTKSNQLEVRRGPYPTVEQYFIRFLNRERRERGLSRVSHWQTLSKLAREHSLNMAEHGYIGHTEPDGDTIKDRYQAIGIFG